MQRQIAILALVTFLTIVFSPAQVDPAKEKDILRLLELTGQRQASASILPLFIRPLADQIVQASPNLAADEFVEAFQKKIAPRLLESVTRNIVVPVFDRRLSDAEIRELITFWESPVGRRFARTQIDLARELQDSNEYHLVVAAVPRLVAEILREMEPDFPEVKSFRLALEGELNPSSEEMEGETTEEEDQFLEHGEYVNRTANLKLAVPDEWHVTRSLQRSGGAVGALESADGALSLLVSHEPFSGSLQEFGNVLLERSRLETGFELLGQSRLELNGRQALRLLVRFERQGTPVNQMLTAVSEDGWVTMMTATCGEAESESAKPVFSAMVDSFRRLTRVVGHGEFTSEGYPSAFRVGGTTQSSKLVYRVTPAYPEEAARVKLQGTVDLLVLIDPRGSVVEIEVLEGEPLLAKAAVEAVRQWGYSPTFLNGERSAVMTKVRVNFVLQE